MDYATDECCPLSLHDALPISPLAWLAATLDRADDPVEGEAQVAADAGCGSLHAAFSVGGGRRARSRDRRPDREDRKSTRLNSSHVKISYAVFCLKKKKSNRKH